MPYAISSIIEKREERAKAFEAMKALDKKAREEKRDMTTDEQRQWDEHDKRIEDLDKEIDKMDKENIADSRGNRILSLETRLSQSINTPPDPGSARASSGPLNYRATDEYHGAFMLFLRNGTAAIPENLRTSMQVDKDELGGFVAASETFINTVLKNADNATFIRDKATVIPCGYEESLGMPKLTQDISEFEFAGELTAAAEDNITFGKRELRPKTLKRKVIPISKRLLTSPRFDTEEFVAQRVGYILGVSQEKAFLTGTGANSPLGLFVASDDGISTGRDVSDGNSTTEIKFDGLLEAIGALKQQYLAAAEWLFHRTAITKIRKLKNGNGDYIWEPGTQNQEPNRILGYPYNRSEYVPNTFTASQYVGMIGDYKYYWIADAISMTIQRLLETYASTGQIGLLFDDMAVDGMPVLEEAFVRVKLAA
jgi:HK97 family phage major capsid protein